MTPLQERFCNKKHGKNEPSVQFLQHLQGKERREKICLGIQMLLSTYCSALCNYSLCSILCQGVPCLAMFIRRLHIKALMLSICFEHIASINQLKASLSTPHKIRRILIWHENINSHVVHFQGCKAT